MRRQSGRVGACLAWDLHGVGPGLAAAALQKAADVVAAAAALHGGDAGGGGGAWARQASHSCCRHWKGAGTKQQALIFSSHRSQTQCRTTDTRKQQKTKSAYRAKFLQIYKLINRCVTDLLNVSTGRNKKHTSKTEYISSSKSCSRFRHAQWGNKAPTEKWMFAKWTWLSNCVSTPWDAGGNI